MIPLLQVEGGNDEPWCGRAGPACRFLAPRVALCMCLPEQRLKEILEQVGVHKKHSGHCIPLLFHEVGRVE